MYIIVLVKSSPPEDVPPMVVALHDDLLPSQDMNHMSCPKVDHIHDNPYLHAPLIYKRNNIGCLDLILSSACSYTRHFGGHRINICDIMVHWHNLVGSAP